MTATEKVARNPYVVLDADTTDVAVTPPAVVMLDPKFIVNVASMVRNCAAFGIDWLILTGDRLDIPTGRKGDRLPRQERMREYRTVNIVQSDFPTVLFRNQDTVPIGVELVPGAVPMPMIEHPDSAVYLLGPEDGSISKGYRAICHHIVQIPSLHCLNVAQAGGIVLYDRMVSLWRQGKTELLELSEQRGMMGA